MFTTLAEFDSRWCVYTRGIGGAGAGGRAFQYVRGKYKPLKGTNLTVAAGRHPFISPVSLIFYFLEGLMLHVICNPVLRCSKQRVRGFIIYYCTWIERYNISIDRYNHVDNIFFTSLFIRRCMLPNTTGEVVVMQCHRH